MFGKVKAFKNGAIFGPPCVWKRMLFMVSVTDYRPTHRGAFHIVVTAKMNTAVDSLDNPRHSL